jgi:DeoR/GlpR family transcriptional regulator of sugar metabolism
MLYNERNEKILDLLKEKQKATVEELAALLYVSTATVRRDLTELQKTGQVKRTHGGAVYVEEADEIAIFIRQTNNAKEKEAVATIALRHLPPFQTLFIDNSSTALALAERMDLTHKTVITNGIQAAINISKRDNVNVILPGGEIKYSSSAVLGSMTTNNLHNFHFDLAVTSCASFDADGAYEFSLESMQIKRTAIARSKQKILLVDRTKIGAKAAFLTSPPENFDFIVTNADNAVLRSLTEANKLLSIFNR